MADNIIKLAAAVLDAALAWEASITVAINQHMCVSLDPFEHPLFDAVRAYRAAKEGT